jgi:hypothetical protein
VVHDQASGLLSAVDGELSSVLVSEQARAGLLQLGARLPELDNARYLECRLGAEASPQVDYLMSLTQPQADVLGRELSPRGLLGPGMAAVERLAEWWQPTGSEVLRSIPIAWIEFDDVHRQAEPAASVCVCLAPTYGNPFVPIAPRSSAEVLETVVQSVRAVSARDLDARQQRAIERCIERLPGAARWIHLSMMTARNPVELKLYGLFPATDLLRYLREVAWPGTLTTLSQFLARYRSVEQPSEMVYVDLPLAAFDERSSVGMGLCFSQQQVRLGGGAPLGDASRTSLLQALTRDGLCTAAEAVALTRWPTSSAGRPDELVNRWLDIKLVYHDARPVLAKAYLGFARRRPTRGGFSLTAREPPGPA